MQSRHQSFAIKRIFKRYGRNFILPDNWLDLCTYKNEGVHNLERELDILF